MLMSAPPEPVCAALPRTAGSRGEAGGGRTGRKEAGEEGGVSGGYLDSVGRLLESDQHVPVSPAGRVPGSELRRGGTKQRVSREAAPPPEPPGSPRPSPPSPHTHALSRSLPPAPPAQAAPRSLPPPPLPAQSLSLAFSRLLSQGRAQYLHESLYSAFGYVQIGGAQMGALVHGSGRVYQEE